MSYESRLERIKAYNLTFGHCAGLSDEIIEGIAKGKVMATSSFSDKQEAVAAKVAKTKLFYLGVLKDNLPKNELIREILYLCAVTRPPVFPASDVNQNAYQRWRDEHAKSTEALFVDWCDYLEKINNNILFHMASNLRVMMTPSGRVLAPAENVDCA